MLPSGSLYPYVSTTGSLRGQEGVRAGILLFLLLVLQVLQHLPSWTLLWVGLGLSQPPSPSALLASSSYTLLSKKRMTSPSQNLAMRSIYINTPPPTPTPGTGV